MGMQNLSSGGDFGRAPSRLVAKGVTVTFGGITALSDVDLELEQAEIVGLIGPNGAGKTTLVNVLTGFQSPTRGTVELDGVDLKGDRPFRVAARGVSRTFQAGRLFKRLTVRENLEVAGFHTGCSRRQARESADRILEQMNLTACADTIAGSLNYGHERRVGIGRALATGPKFVLMDEPASGMNDAECEELVACILDIPGQFGCGVLLIEHNMTVILKACERIQVMDGGRRIAMDRPDAIVADPRVRAAYFGTRHATSAGGNGIH